MEGGELVLGHRALRDQRAPLRLMSLVPCSGFRAKGEWIRVWGLGCKA